jgi:type I restriction enzyme S subunit
MGRTPDRGVPAFWGPGHLWLSIADMKRKHLVATKEQITDAGAAGMLPIPSGTLIMSFKLTIGRLAFADRDMFSNEAICSLRAPTVDPEFLYYALAKVDFARYGKQAVKGFTLNLESLQSIELDLPEPSERRLIAVTLGRMDQEIEDLEAQLTKRRNVRTAVVQNVLSGRTQLA